MVGTKTGDCVVVGAASGAREVEAGAADCAAVVSAGVGTVVGAAVAAVPFRAGATVPATAVVARGTIVEEAVVTDVVTEEVEAAVVVAVGTGALDTDPTIADTGIAIAKATNRVHNRIRFKDTYGVIRVHWMPEDMRIMDGTGHFVHGNKAS
jgi:hypothetical protein